MDSNVLLLLSGNDIPFEEAQLTIHPPKLKEIAYIGEESFWNGLELLTFSKSLLGDDDKNNLESKTDFEVFLLIMQDSSVAMQLHKIQMELVLSILFPVYHSFFTPNAIAFRKEGDKTVSLIDNDKKFTAFKQILNEIFCLEQLQGNKHNQEYNPANHVAQQLVDKFKQRKKKLAKLKKDAEGGSSSSVLATSASILAIGQPCSLTQIMDYTVFQLMDNLNRYQLKMNFDINLQARMAGAKDLKEAENWMKNIHWSAEAAN